jgi:phosphotriesterase-related protein
MFYKKAGGNTIVDLTCTPSLGRDPLGLTRISRATGVNIILGSGYYESWTGYENTFVANKTEEELAVQVVKEIIEGIDDTGVRAGIIGEIGMYWPFSDIQRKVLQVSTRAQRLTGAALNIHLPLGASSVLPRQKDHEEIVMEVVKALDDAGADLNRTAFSHVDVCCFTPEFRKKLAETGCYIGYDSFGIESYSVPIWGTPNDWQRVEEIVQLIDGGYLNQILISCDHCMKHQCRRYGGWGYDHILTSVLPMMRVQGMSEEQINTILVQNPKRILTFVPTKD